MSSFKLPDVLNSTVFMNKIPDEYRGRIGPMPLSFLYPILLNPISIFTIMGAYLFVCSRTWITNHKIKIPMFNGLVAVHNLLLAGFSMYTFFGATPLWIDNLALRGRHKTFWKAWCDKEEYTWNGGLYQYAWLFYLSKFYELIDTAILILKNKRPSTLQLYHHTGALFCCFLGVYTRATGGWIFLLFNSFIHSIMYTYFFLTSLKVKLPVQMKAILTRMQIGQFVIGGIIGLPYFFLPNCRKGNSGELFAFCVAFAYLIPLTRLFWNFAVSVYGWGKKENSMATTGDKQVTPMMPATHQAKEIKAE